MTVLFLLACSLVVSIIIAWLLRRRLAFHIPRKEAMTTWMLVAAIVVLASIALLPDILIMASTMKLLALHFKIVLTFLVALGTVWAVTCIGCSKQPEPAHPIHWSAPETGYHAETTPDNTGQPKEEP